jgi:hypothetical protein
VEMMSTTRAAEGALRAAKGAGHKDMCLR